MPSEFDGPWHLLYPLFSSILFVIGALFAKRGAQLGVGPYTNTVACDLILALIWFGVAVAKGAILPWWEWGPAAGIACAFVIGQLCTYLAFQYGDVSLATPILGVKIIFVALISSLLAAAPLPLHLWVAAFLASVAVGIVQMGGGSINQKKSSTWRTGLTVLLALLSAFAFSCFDVGLQAYGPTYGATPLLATMFVLMGLISCLLLPLVDSPRRLLQLNAGGILFLAALCIAIQASSISFALGQHGDATRVNIIYSLRGIWSVLIVWLLNQLAISPEGKNSPRTMWFRLIGAVLLLICVILALV